MTASVCIFLNLCLSNKREVHQISPPSIVPQYLIFERFGFSSTAPLIDFSCSYNNPMEWLPKISSQHIFHLKFSNPLKCSPAPSTCSIPKVMMHLMVKRKPYRVIRLVKKSLALVPLPRMTSTFLQYQRAGPTYRQYAWTVCQESSSIDMYSNAQSPQKNWSSPGFPTSENGPNIHLESRYL